MRDKCKENMTKASKTRTSKQDYHIPAQFKLIGFETPFEKNFNFNNRWVLLTYKVSWNSIVKVYNTQFKNQITCRFSNIYSD